MAIASHPSAVARKTQDLSYDLLKGPGAIRHSAPWKSARKIKEELTETLLEMQDETEANANTRFVFLGSSR